MQRFKNILCIVEPRVVRKLAVERAVALSADSKEELLEAAIQHGTHVHHYEDTPEFRDQLMNDFKEGTPPA